MKVWAAEARALFKAQSKDSIDAGNFRPFELVGNMARRLLRSLGRENMAQAHAIEPVLDSLGLETAVRVDPVYPTFALVSVRNPYRRTSNAIGLVVWYRGKELHQQGVTLLSGRDPQMRVWWPGRPQRLYSMGILDRAPDGRLAWLLLGMTADGYGWNIDQFVDQGPGGGGGQGAFTDVNGDGLPELVLWSRARLDSAFTLCSDCPGPLDENTLVERAEGFEPYDSRLMPSPITTLSLFVRLLREGNHAAAARLLHDPKKVDEALALGWNVPHGRGTWDVEYGEPAETWPRWLAVRFRDEKRQLYIFHFALKEGRWIIVDWIPVQADRTKPDSTGVIDRK